MNCVKLLQLLLAVKTALAMRLHILTKDSKILTRSGQNLTLPCAAKGRNFDPFSNPLIWYKVADNGEEFQINTGAVISFPYAETGRYAVEPRMEFTKISTVWMPLSIRDLTLAENGTYRCELRSKSKVLASTVHQIDVIAPINRLDLNGPRSRVDNTTRQQVFEFFEHEPSSVSCEFEGAPPAVLHVIRGEVDVTPLFTRAERVDVVGEPGLQHSVYTIRFASEKLRMQREHDGEKLYCAAQVPTFTELSSTKTALIRVLYAAAFSCETDLVAAVGEVDLQISCTITANPPVNVDSVWWTFSRSDMNLTHEQSRGELSSRIAVKGNEVIANLMIANVSNSSFQTYYLNARTPLANRQHAIVLQEDVPATQAPPTTEAPTTTATTVKAATAPTPRIHSSPAAATTPPHLVASKPTERSTSFPSTFSVVETAKPSTSPPQTTTFSTLSTLSTTATQTVTPTSSTAETSTHRRRKHQKHKHKKKKQRKEKEKEREREREKEREQGREDKSSSKATTVSMFTSTQAALTTSKVLQTKEVSKNPRNKTTANKTLGKQEIPGDVHYTIIDEPVKDSSAKTHRPLTQIVLLCALTIFVSCFFPGS